ncbi:hypothetical protein IW150_000481 [Coemansia sp. RSA 2607]|nr:hypothetical protein IW150_000481 [Coemansia sp. RSA 2607]
MRLLVCTSCHVSRRLVRQTHKPTATEYADAYALKTTSTPHPTLPPRAQQLRHKLQSNPWVKQLTSGQRKSIFASTHLPKDHLLRVKTKRDAQGAPLLCVDELEEFSRVTGKSAYLPNSARGVYAALTDQANRRNVAEFGKVRRDFVEHCAKVLRLRVISEVQRARIVMLSHRNVKEPLGERTDGMSRLDMIRLEIRHRIQRQDAQWAGNSPFIDLTDFTPDAQHKVATILPAAGLQCILKLPPSPLPTRLSTSSESDARTVFSQLMQMQGKEETLPDVLDQSGGSWVAHVMGSAPMPMNEPTLSEKALALLYTCLPRVVPISMDIVKDARAKKQGANKEPALIEPSFVETQGFVKDADIAYEYSLERTGDATATADGDDTKSVPVYDAAAVFGHDIAATVLSWLLHSPATPSTRYIGIVALPCTTNLAAQLHRLAVYLSKLQ